MTFGNSMELVHDILPQLIFALALVVGFLWIWRSTGSKWTKVFKTLGLGWFFFVMGFSFYYGSLPLWGSTVPTAEQPEAVQIKGTIRYVTPEIARRSRMAEKLFMYSWYAGVASLAVYQAKRVYWPNKDENDLLK